MPPQERRETRVDPDILFVAGAALPVLAFPAAVGAFTEGRAPRVAAILVMVGGGLMGLAAYQRPGLYSFETAPQAVVRVVDALLG